MLWSVDAPNLYHCKAVYRQDEVIEKFGIRQLEWNRQKGIAINGERVILRGACIHVMYLQGMLFPNWMWQVTIMESFDTSMI